MRGYFGIGIENTKNERNVGTLWRSASNFEAAFMFTAGRRYHHQCSDTLKAWRHIPLLQFADISELVIPHSCLLVGVEIVGQSIDLIEFEHPERAIYLLGAEDHGLSKAAIDRCHQFVEIPSHRCLNVAVAGAIVMYDRLAKAVRAKTNEQ
jgi:tRNA G18 (ribose-2'-O)-methylase SpoU